MDGFLPGGAGDSLNFSSSVIHDVTLKKVRQWVNGGAKTPKEAVTKERLRELL